VNAGAPRARGVESCVQRSREHQAGRGFAKQGKARGPAGPVADMQGEGEEKARSGAGLIRKIFQARRSSRRGLTIY